MPFISKCFLKFRLKIQCEDRFSWTLEVFLVVYLCVCVLNLV